MFTKGTQVGAFTLRTVSMDLYLCTKPFIDPGQIVNYRPTVKSHIPHAINIAEFRACTNLLNLGHIIPTPSNISRISGINARKLVPRKTPPEKQFIKLGNLEFFGDFVSCSELELASSSSEHERSSFGLPQHEMHGKQDSAISCIRCRNLVDLRYL